MSKLTIDVGGGDLDRWIDQTWVAIVNANDEQYPKVLLHGNNPVRVTEDGLAPYNVASLREQISRVAAYVAQTQRGPVQKTPPREVAESLLAREPEEFDGGPRVERFTDVPIVTAAGTILSRPGHHAAERVYHRPAEGLGDLRIPGPGEVDTVDEVVEARDFLLDEWLGEFGFADEASKANALAMLLTPFVRDLINGGTPLFVIHAPQWGWGKGLLTDACLIPGCGTVPTTASSDTEEEMRKRITSALRKVPSAVIFDNQTGHLDSRVFAQVLTTGKWEDRILGVSENLVAEPRNVWTVNGNNFTLSGELIERAPAPILLGPGQYWDDLCQRKGWDPTLRPRQRPRSQYAQPHFRAWAQEHRAEAVVHAFTLIRHWLDGRAEVIGAGHSFYRPNLDKALPEEERALPELPDRDTGEFPEWQRVVGGILKAADVPGFAENYEAWATAADDEGEEIADFLEAWHDLGLGAVEFKEVLAQCTTPNAPMRDHLPDDLAEARGDQLHGKLKAWLRDHRDQRYGGFRLVRQDGRPRLWEVFKG